MLRYCIVVALTIWFSAFPFARLEAEPPPPDRSVWEEVDIVPMPKRIRLTGRRLSLSNAAIVLGEKSSEQDRIGAGWINDRIVEKGGKALPVVTEGASGEAALRIIAGTRGTNQTIDQAVRENLIEIGLGRCSYVIQPRTKGPATELLLGGADPIGALYACVTLAGLLDGQGDNLVLREAEVVDWPDYPTVTDGISLKPPEIGSLGRRLRTAATPTAEQKEEYLRAMKDYLDRLLGWKISGFRPDHNEIGATHWENLSPEYLAAFHEVTAYAKARGIHTLIYAMPPFVGLRKDFPDVPERCLTGLGRDRYGQYIRCWSMDEERRKTAAQMGRFALATGITDLGFHDSDTGGFLNPAQWEERCEVCRKRWGDDFAAATINKHRIYYDEIKKIAPDCRIHFTLYPYNISILTQDSAERYCIEEYGPGPSVPDTARRLRERFTDFWTRVTTGLPNGVTFCIRENIPANVKRFHELTAPHGTFIWYKVGSEQWETFFDESPRWAPTFFSGGDDLMFTVSLETFVPIKVLAVREYAWNIQTPGATGWAQLPLEERWRHAEAKGEIYTTILPHVVRNLFGRRAAPRLTEALSLNMAMNHIFDHLPSRKKRAPILTNYEKWRWQVEQAEKGCEILDKLFEEFKSSGDRLGMTPFAARRFVYIREVFHCCKWMAQAKAQNMLAREQAKAGKVEDARAAIQRGREIVAGAREDMKRLVAERPDDPIYNVKADPKNVWQIFTPGNQVDWEVPEKMLAQTEAELASLAAAGQLPPKALEALSARRTVHVAPAAETVKIDGHLAEPEWRTALPAEAFLVYPGGQGIARAQTRARFLRDEKTLYVGITCWMPDNALIRAQARERDENVMEDEQVELFLMPPNWRGGYAQFQINAEGSIADKRVTLAPSPAGAPAKKPDRNWNAEGMVVKTSRRPGAWEMEAAIPISALEASRWAGGWRVNVCRDFKGEHGGRELSSILPPSAKDFHDTAVFPVLSFDPTPAPPPEVEIAVAGLKDGTRTLDDRVATVAEFGLDIRSSRVLHDVRITAEAYDSSGRPQKKSMLRQLDHLTFYWQPEETFSAAFAQEIQTGGVRLALESQEARAERWIRLGGWEGAPDIGSIFSPPAGGDKTQDIRQGQGLIGLCNLPGEVTGPKSKESLRIVGQRRGAIEFWFKSFCPPPHPLETEAPWKPRRVLLHCGILRRDYPENFNCSSLTVYSDAEGRSFCFMIRNRSYAGWTASCRIENEKPWDPSNWHHLACVWDYEAKPEDWLRIYLDGVRAQVKTETGNPDRLGEDKAVALDKMAYAIQVGSLNTGRHPARAILDELRISRTARYGADFTPSPGPFALDRGTSALFHFDGDLNGEGMSETGDPYTIHGVAGVLEFH